MPDADPTILDHLQIKPIERSELPFGFKPLSMPLSIYSDSAVIASMWQSLRGVCLVTRKGNTIQFWREPVAKVNPKGGALKYRSKPGERWRDA